MPGILIHILLESLFTSPRNRYSHAPEYAVTLFQSFIYAVGCFSVMVFFYVFHRAQ